MNSTGNTAVDMMGSLNITGNVIPVRWCHTILYPNGKPCLNAIIILSDIVYWYRPREIRDERTGNVIRLEKKFKADLLQRNYQDFADQFGLSKKQAKDALDLLENLGIIYRDFRTLVIRGRAMNNVLYIGLNVDKLREYTDNDYSSPDGDSSKSIPSQHQSEESPVADDTTPRTSMNRAIYPDVDTNTENTSETTTDTTTDTTTTVVVTDAADILSDLSLDNKDIDRIVSAAKGDSTKIDNAYKALQAYRRPVESVVGFLIDAINKGYKTVSHQPTSINSFQNFQQRDYDFNELENRFARN